MPCATPRSSRAAGSGSGSASRSSKRSASAAKRAQTCAATAAGGRRMVQRDQLPGGAADEVERVARQRIELFQAEQVGGDRVAQRGARAREAPALGIERVEDDEESRAAVVQAPAVGRRHQRPPQHLPQRRRRFAPRARQRVRDENATAVCADRLGESSHVLVGPPDAALEDPLRDRKRAFGGLTAEQRRRPTRQVHPHLVLPALCRNSRLRERRSISPA
jgi:hypothetical protein